MTTETHIADGIKITVHTPEKGEIPEYIRERKINQLYDLLAPRTDNRKTENEKEI
ncbi:MAG: hypothetical protein NC299_17050 [Lachnospiraceae bacterium]|nr:hypothetical protein [Ruminococcus sp.]MCM1277039.1 hypothetical protein [Lachnospiraceae bacterium]